MIDLHSHLLPGVDDGSPSVDVSLGVLRRFADDGVSTLVCTPHLKASQAGSAPIERHREIFAALCAVAPPLPSLRLGWEIMLDEPGVDLAVEHLSLGGSRAVLVEFPRTGVPSGAPEELYRIRMSGVVPVLAHPERYWGATVERVREWRRVGAVVQADASTLLGNGTQSKLAQAMLAEGLVDVIASDNHGDQRSLRAARTWLEEIGAAEQAHVMTAANPGRVLAGEPMLPVAPVQVDRGMLRRLRELLFGR